MGSKDGKPRQFNPASAGNPLRSAFKIDIESQKMWSSIGLSTAMIHKGQAQSMELAGGVRVYLDGDKVKIEIPLARLNQLDNPMKAEHTS